MTAIRSRASLTAGSFISRACSCVCRSVGLGVPSPRLRNPCSAGTVSRCPGLRSARHDGCSVPVLLSRVLVIRRPGLVAPQLFRWSELDHGRLRPHTGLTDIMA